MVLRQRKKPLNKVVQELDAFPKVPETYVETTASGASISVVTFLLVCCLVYSEAHYFLNPGFTFRFVPDTDLEAKLTINVDITVAMTCDSLGADILDSTNQNTFTFGRLKEEPTWFELDHLQRQHFDSIKTFNEYLREEYHAVQDLMWKSGQAAYYGSLPQRRFPPDEPHDACRIHGTLNLNKVSGNFHISAGKSVQVFGGHAHLAGFMTDSYNFSHRIDRFSFGSPHGGIVQPLEGDEKLAEKRLMNYQYFVEVVPTDIQTSAGFTYATYQYSVKDQERPIDSEFGQAGVPGIYFKYDMSALKVLVHQDREPLWQFLVRLCAGVGGLVATSQLVCGLVKGAISFYCCAAAAKGGGEGAATLDLLSPGDRAAVAKAAEAATASVTQQPVTLQEVEKLIKS